MVKFFSRFVVVSFLLTFVICLFALLGRSWRTFLFFEIGVVEIITALFYLSAFLFTFKFLFRKSLQAFFPVMSLFLFLEEVEYFNIFLHYTDITYFSMHNYTPIGVFLSVNTVFVLGLLSFVALIGLVLIIKNFGWFVELFSKYPWLFYVCLAVFGLVSAAIVDYKVIAYSRGGYFEELAEFNSALSILFASFIFRMK